LTELRTALFKFVEMCENLRTQTFGRTSNWTILVFSYLSCLSFVLCCAGAFCWQAWVSTAQLPAKALLLGLWLFPHVCQFSVLLPIYFVSLGAVAHPTVIVTLPPKLAVVEPFNCYQVCIFSPPSVGPKVFEVVCYHWAYIDDSGSPRHRLPPFKILDGCSLSICWKSFMHAHAPIIKTKRWGCTTGVISLSTGW